MTCLFLFYCQLYSKTDYLSDLKAHIKFSIMPDDEKSTGYSLLHNVINLFANKVSNYAYVDLLTAANLCMIIILSFSIYLMTLFIRNYYDNYAQTYSLKSTFLTFGTSLVSMIITVMPGVSEGVYLGNGTPNPWHNPTYLICRPFSMLVFLMFIIVLNQSIKNQISKINLFLLTLFALLSMWFKPSFLISFLPTMACILGLFLLKKKIQLKNAVLIGCSFLPAVIIIIFIYKFVFHGKSDNSISFGIGEFWHLYSKNLLISLALGMSFPIYVFILKIKNLNLDFQIAALNYFFSFLIVYFISETGERAAHGNFFWTYLFAMFFMFLVATKIFFLESKFTTWQKTLGFVLYGAHLGSGILYFSQILKGKVFF